MVDWHDEQPVMVERAGLPADAVDLEETEPTSAGYRRGLLSRPATRWVLVAVAAALVYAVVLTLYAASGRNEGSRPTSSPLAAGVQVFIDLGDLDAATDRQYADITIVPGDDLLRDDGITPNVDIDLVLVPTAGQQQLRFPAGKVPATFPVQLLVDGEIENWPFDRYQSAFLFQVRRATSGDKTTGVPFTVTVDGHVKGWKTTFTPLMDVAATSTELQQFEYSAKRAGGTLAFGLVMLLSLVTLPVLALFATSQVLRGRRRMEPAFASWIAAMLFATVPLRNFLPGSPPAGSWIDIAVVLWVIVGLVSALVLYVVAWWHHGHPGRRAAPILQPRSSSAAQPDTDGPLDFRPPTD